MVFQELDKLKRQIIMSSIVLMSAGILLLLLPVGYVGFTSKLIGFSLLVFSLVSVFQFIGGSKILLHYIQLCLGLGAGILGFAMLTIDGVFITLLSWLVGTVPIISGGAGIFHSLTFARRSGKKSWWILLLLSSTMLAFGGFVFCNPWMKTDHGLMQVTGGALMSSAFVSALRLIWSFSKRTEE